MDLLTASFLWLMKQHPSIYDREDEARRAERMHIVAEAIEYATKRAACQDQPLPCKPIFSNRQLMTALLLAKGRGESAFAAYVHEGRCQEGPVGARCDPDKKGVARAHGPWQQWPASVFPHSDWDAMHQATLEGTKLAAWHATKLLAGGEKSCPNRFPDPIESQIAMFSGSCIRMTEGKVKAQARHTRQILAVLPAR